MLFPFTVSEYICTQKIYSAIIFLKLVKCHFYGLIKILQGLEMQTLNVISKACLTQFNLVSVLTNSNG